jgi:hypothetical protein
MLLLGQSNLAVVHATSYSPINMAVNAGGASVTQQTIAGSSGTMLVWMENIGGFIVGGVM